MEAYQANGQSVRLQKVQIVQAAPSGANLQQATLNGQPVLLQVNPLTLIINDLKM